MNRDVFLHYHPGITVSNGEQQRAVSYDEQVCDCYFGPSDVVSTAAAPSFLPCGRLGAVGNKRWCGLMLQVEVWNTLHAGAAGHIL